MNFLLSDGPSLVLPLLLLSIPLLVISLKLLTAQFDMADVRPEAAIKGEKRRAARAKTNAVIDLDDEAGGYSPGNAQLQDLSVWGACLSSTLSLQKGQSIRGRIHSPTEGLLQVSGHVVWVKQRNNDYLYGIAFSKITRTENSL